MESLQVLQISDILEMFVPLQDLEEASRLCGIKILAWSGRRVASASSRCHNSKHELPWLDLDARAGHEMLDCPTQYSQLADIAVRPAASLEYCIRHK